jgi:hypothetical protein
MSINTVNLPLKNFDIEIIVNGLPITKYLSPENNQLFVEGRKGSEFTLLIKNQTANKVLAVPSVDGLSVFDGKPASNNSQGYILYPFKNIAIPGWTLDNSSVAKFIFTEKERSYSSQSGQGTNNVGVIGCIFFNEQPRPIPQYDFSYIQRKTFIPEYLPDIYPLTYTSTNQFSTMCYNSMDSGTFAVAAAAPPVENDVGTGFGKSTNFNTYAEEFKRTLEPAEIINIYYGSRKYLEQFGIRFSPPVVKTLPVAFPGNGCTPPPGWQR